MLKLYRTMLDSGENYSHAYPSSDHSDVLHYFDVVILIRENHKFTLIFLAIPERSLMPIFEELNFSPTTEINGSVCKYTVLYCTVDNIHHKYVHVQVCFHPLKTSTY